MYKTYSYILSENIAGYGAGNKKPSGYCKIKCLSDKNTIDLNVRNIDTSKNKYNCYLIYFKDKYYGVNIGEATITSENNICLRKDIDHKGELKGFAITSETEDDKTILCGYDETEFWDGLFIKENAEMLDIQAIKKELKIDNKEEKELRVEKKEEEIEEDFKLKFNVPNEENDDDGEGVSKIEDVKKENKKVVFQNTKIFEEDEGRWQLIKHRVEDKKEANNEHINETEFRRIHMDDLILMDRFKWSVFNNIFLYISNKQYGYILYKEELDKCILAVPIEGKYKTDIKRRYKYVENNGEKKGYMILEW